MCKDYTNFKVSGITVCTWEDPLNTHFLFYSHTLYRFMLCVWLRHMSKRGERLLVNIITMFDKPWRAQQSHRAVTSGNNSDLTKSPVKQWVSEGFYPEITGSNWRLHWTLDWSDNSLGWWFLLCFNHLHFNYTLCIIPSRLILLNTLSSCPFPINNILGKKQITLSQVRVAKRTEGGLSDAYIYESFKLATLIHAE